MIGREHRMAVLQRPCAIASLLVSDSYKQFDLSSDEPGSRHSRTRLKRRKIAVLKPASGTRSLMEPALRDCISACCLFLLFGQRAQLSVDTSHGGFPE